MATVYLLLIDMPQHLLDPFPETLPAFPVRQVECGGVLLFLPGLGIDDQRGFLVRSVVYDPVSGRACQGLIHLVGRRSRTDGDYALIYINVICG